MHGGTVQAKSEGNDKGTEIIIRVPLNRPAGGTGTQHSASE
jgi:hypothetical protein